jgi:hypothetical protein
MSLSVLLCNVCVCYVYILKMSKKNKSKKRIDKQWYLTSGLYYPGGSMSYVVGLPSNSYKPITNTAWVRARLCKLQKRVHSTVLNKNWKIYWSEQSFTGLGLGDRCSWWGLWSRPIRSFSYSCCNYNRNPGWTKVIIFILRDNTVRTAPKSILI